MKSNPLQLRMAFGAILALLATSSAGFAEQATGTPTLAVEQAETSPAADTVLELFAALKAGDCSRINAVLGPTLRARLEGRSCSEFLAGEGLAHADEVKIIRERVDGRAVTATLLDIEVRVDGRRRSGVVRVETDSQGRRITSL